MPTFIREKRYDTVMKKLHLGAGTDIKTGWVNHDLAPLPSIDVVHDLRVFPWPWKDGEFSEIVAKDVLEHLPDLLGTMTELHRICAPGAQMHISVPYWNSYEAVTDPTHMRQFNEFTFEFFDPRTKRCQRRPYYSSARFHIKSMGFGVKPLAPYIQLPYISAYRVIENKWLKKIVGWLASYLSNIIVGLEIRLEKPRL